MKKIFKKLMAKALTGVLISSVFLGSGMEVKAQDYNLTFHWNPDPTNSYEIIAGSDMAANNTYYLFAGDSIINRIDGNNFSQAATECYLYPYYTTNTSEVCVLLTYSGATIYNNSGNYVINDLLNRLNNSHHGHDGHNIDYFMLKIQQSDVAEFDFYGMQFLTEPTIEKNILTYNGQEQEIKLLGYDKDKMDIEDFKKTEVGDYQVKITPKDGYFWSANSRDPKYISWSIVPADQSKSESSSGKSSVTVVGNGKQEEKTKKDTPVHEHSYSWSVVSEVTESGDGLEIYQCSCGDVKAKSIIPASQAYVSKFRDAIKYAPANGTVTYDSKMNHTFSDYIIKRLAERTDVTTVIDFKYNHTDYTMTIPAGIDYTALLADDIEFYGYFYFAQLTGATVVAK